VPWGQVETHWDPERYVPATQAVHDEAEDAHVLQGAVQLLHTDVPEDEDANVPMGQAE